ncbi:MAG: PAS domain S-box protein [Cyclobacteriaceae bacterium]
MEHLNSLNKEFQERVINGSTLLIAIGSTLALVLNFYRLSELDIDASLFVHVTGTICLWFSYVLKSQLSLNLKAAIFFFFMYLLLINGLYVFGFLASSIIYIPSIPVFISFILGTRRATFALVLMIITYIFFASLYTSGTLLLELDVDSYLSGISSWALELLVLCIISGGLLFVSHQYQKVLINNVEKIREKDLSLHDNELKYSELFDNAQYAIMILENDKFTDCNEMACQYFGYKKAELLSKDPFVMSPEFQPNGRKTSNMAREYLDKAIDGEPQFFEWQHQHKDGSPIDVSISLSQVQLQNRSYLQAVMHDISAQKNAESELSKTKNLLEAAIEQSPSGIIISDATGSNIKYANQAAYGNVNPNEKNINQVIKGWEVINEDGTFLNTNELPLARAVKKGESTHEQEMIIRDETGDRWVSANASPIYDASGAINAGIIVFHDITQRKQTLEALESSERKFRTLAENVPATVYLCKNDERFTMLYLNDKVEKLTGYPKERFLSDQISFSELYHPEDREQVFKIVDDALAKQQPFHIVYRLKHRDGKWIWMEEFGTGIFQDGELLFLEGIFFDISGKKNDEIELENYRRNLEQLVQDKTKDLEDAYFKLQMTNTELSEKSNIIEQQNKELTKALDTLKGAQGQLVQAEKMASLGILTAGVAHEINNPLNYIMGGFEGLKAYFKTNNTSDKELTTQLLSSIREGIDRVTKIVRGLNQFSRDNEQFDETCDVHGVLDNCLIVLQNQLKNRVTVERNFNAEQSILLGNVGKLHQCFINLLINSSQAIEGEGTIKISTENTDSHFKVMIADNGCGISEENLKKITDPFYTTKDPGVGTGLGLSITYSIVDSHNGKLIFESEFGVSTTATIILPFPTEK